MSARLLAICERCFACQSLCCSHTLLAIQMHSSFCTTLELDMSLYLCRAFGQPSEGISIGPVKFSRTAELLNGRAAMVG